MGSEQEFSASAVGLVTPPEEIEQEASEDELPK